MPPGATVGHILIRVYAELNEYLDPSRQRRDFTVDLHTPVDVLDLLVHLGIPPQRVDLVLINGHPAHPGHPIDAGDRVSIYPVFEAFDVSGVTQFRQEPLRNPRFVADVHLGKLAAFLRMLGFDTLYRRDYDDDELVRVSREEQRILLTKDIRLLQHPSLTHAHRVHADDPEGQIAEVVQRLDLSRLVKPFTRCMVCNALLEQIAPEAVADRLPPLVRRRFDTFFRCQGCGRLYWKGSHYQKMVALIERVLREGNEE